LHEVLIISAEIITAIKQRCVYVTVREEYIFAKAIFLTEKKLENMAKGILSY